MRCRWGVLRIDAGERILSFAFYAVEQLTLVRNQDREPVGAERAPDSAGAGAGRRRSSGSAACLIAFCRRWGRTARLDQAGGFGDAVLP